jgi:hypothetical protein
MRIVRALIACAVGCTPAAVPSARPAAPVAAPKVAAAAVEEPFVPLDLMATLAASDDAWQGTFIGPVPVRLELGGATYASIDTPNVPARVVEKAGKAGVRVAVRLDHVRFGAWVDAWGVLAVIAHDTPVAEFAGGGSSDFTAGEQDPMEIELRTGAHVRRLKHENGWTEVRYDGGLEVNGWVPDAALVDALAPRQKFGRVPTGAQQLMLLPGAAFKTKPEWAARELAVLASGYVVDSVKQIDDDWFEARYADDDVRLHGVVSRHAPPSRVHHPKERDDTGDAIVPDTNVADGTCLYAREDGDPIGFLVGAQAVQVVDAGRNWFSLYVATPWQRLPFYARGASRTLLATCGPTTTPPTATP